MKLHRYQSRFVRELREHLATSTRAVLVSPTGSGKSLIVSTLAAALHRDGVFTSIAVCVPMVHVQSSFGAVERVRCGREVFDVAALGWAYVHGDGAVSKFCAALRGESDAYVTVATHAALVGPGLECIEGADLSDRLLVIDEGHHTAHGKVNELSKARDAWLAQGGSVLVVTATPFRHDGARVADDSWEVFQRTIIDHIDDKDPAGPFAPPKLECRTTVLEGTRPTSAAALYDTTKGGIEARREVADRITAQWVEDSREGVPPAALIIVPAYATQSWVRMVKASLEDAGGLDPERVLDATGIGRAAQLRTRVRLDAERELGERAWLDANIDVVVACKRFDEASDWPICSHVYVIGYPSSIPHTLQRWGRAFRSKTRITDHAFPDVASLTFFVPEWSDELREDAGKSRKLARYRDDAYLLACCLHDYTTGLKYARQATADRRRALGKDTAKRFEFTTVERAKARQDVDRAQARATSDELSDSGALFFSFFLALSSCVA